MFKFQKPKALPKTLLTITLALTCALSVTGLVAMAQQEPLGTSGQSNIPALVGSIVQSDYILDAGDMVDIDDVVMGKIGERIKILADGSVNLPLVGKVYLGGLSVAQAHEELDRLYKKYYVNPSISLQVSYQRPVRVYINGAVKSPGVYISGKNLQPQAGGGGTNNAILGRSDNQDVFYRLYLTDAIIMAGGLNYNANTADVKIVRSFPKPQTIHVNMLELIASGNIIQDLPLRDKDIIEVTEIPKESVVMDAKWEDVIKSNISIGSYKVNVIGAVNKPGSFDLRTEDDIFKAIAEAGGFTEKADQKQIYILRTNSAGQVFKRQVNLSDKALMSKQPLQKTAMLLPNDVIFVDESTSKAVGKGLYNVLNQITNATAFSSISRMFSFIDFTNSGN